MKKSLIILFAIVFTSMNVFAENMHNEVVVKSSIKNDPPNKDWKSIKKAILKSDTKTIREFAGNHILDSDSLVQEAAAMSYIHEVLKSYEYKHLLKEELSGINYLVFEAYTSVTHSDNTVTAHIFKLYMTESEGKLLISFYVNVEA